MAHDLPDLFPALSACASCQRRKSTLGARLPSDGPFLCRRCWGGHDRDPIDSSAALADWWLSDAEAREWLARARAALPPEALPNINKPLPYHVVLDPKHQYFHGVGSRKVWPAVHRIIDYLDDALSEPRGIAIELGAGCGVPGIHLAKHGWKVVLTDLPIILPFTTLNVDANFAEAANEDRPRIAPLRWGCRADLDALPKRPTLCFGSDLVYFDDDYQPLLSTLKDIDAEETILAIQNRNACHEAFAEAARSSGWTVEPAMAVSKEFAGLGIAPRSYSCSRCTLLKLTRLAAPCPLLLCEVDSEGRTLWRWAHQGA